MGATTSASPSHQTLNGIPSVDIPANVQAALATGRRAATIVGEAAALRFGPGRLSPQEYLYYRLWETRLALADKKAFVGKLAQQPMHEAAGTREWYAASADKILFHAIMAGVGLRTPPLLAITQAGRSLPQIPTIAERDDLAQFLREPSLYPLFAKQVAGKYSLAVASVDSYDPGADEVILLGGARRKVSALAASLVGGAGYLIQRRLSPTPLLAARFGPRLWSVRALVLVTPAGPLLHRAVAKIATGANPADNYWRSGNRLGAIDLDTGRIGRVVAGTGAELRLDDTHPDTGAPLAGTVLPGWDQVVAGVMHAAQVFAGIRTQSWDIALADPAPTFLELNFGGDLNLHQLAHGQGVLDAQYRAHLRHCGYKGRLCRR